MDQPGESVRVVVRTSLSLHSYQLVLLFALPLTLGCGHPPSEEATIPAQQESQPDLSESSEEQTTEETADPMPAADETVTHHPPAGSGDPIAWWVAHLSQQPLWNNGLSPRIDLPAAAPPEDVLRAMFGAVSFDEGRVNDHRVVESRVVTITGSQYTALRVETNLGEKVVLMEHNAGSGWRTRVL